MQNNEAYQIFLREVLRRANTFKKTMDQMIIGMGATTSESRREKAQVLLNAAEELCNILPEKDRPPWLMPLREAVGRFVHNFNDSNAESLISEIIRRSATVIPSQVLPTGGGPSPYEFDRFYDKARTEAKITELFDAHIDAVAKIVDSGEIESVTALNALIQLAAALKANRNASYSAVKQTVFLAKFIQNVVLVGLQKVPGIGILVEAAEKTLKDTEDGLDRLEREMESQVESAVREALPRVTQTTELMELQRRALPAPTDDASVATSKL
jgi:hypothetical protein